MDCKLDDNLTYLHPHFKNISVYSAITPLIAHFKLCEALCRSSPREEVEGVN